MPAKPDTQNLNLCVLFVCAGNVFRSPAAELNARKFAEKEKLAADFSSAGLVGKQGKKLRSDVKSSLRKRNLDFHEHQVRLVTKDMLDKQDVVIAMDENILEGLKTKFNRESVLFNKLAYGREEGIPDLWEAVPDYRENTPEAARYVEDIIAHISKGTPALISKLCAS